MNQILEILLVMFLAIVGFLPCIFLIASLPIIIAWKIYRKIKYNIPVTK